MRKVIKKQKYKGCDFVIYEEADHTFCGTWVDKNDLEHNTDTQTDAAKAEEQVKDQIDVEGTEPTAIMRARMNMPLLRGKRLSMDTDEYTGFDTRTMEEVSRDIRQAGSEGQAEKPTTGSPQKKSPEDMKEDPNAILNPQEDKQVDGKVVETMGAKTEMPGTHVDEAAWKEAKAATKKQYPNVSEDNDRFWEITQTIYKNMVG